MAGVTVEPLVTPLTSEASECNCSRIDGLVDPAVVNVRSPEDTALPPESREVTL